MSPPWLQPLATLIAALMVLVGAGITIRQRGRADRKDQWWKRTQWAVDHVLRDAGGSNGELGLRVMQEQAKRRSADVEDKQLLAVIIDMRLASMRAAVQNGDDGLGRE